MSQNDTPSPWWLRSGSTTADPADCSCQKRSSVSSAVRSCRMAGTPRALSLSICTYLSRRAALNPVPLVGSSSRSESTSASSTPVSRPGSTATGRWPRRRPARSRQGLTQRKLLAAFGSPWA
ncbi:hypothetical protein [Kitasatospora griseola]|uniref:hypothetical protein n=1 Tax=Kitasatospora griseola TaxID=2064 RepID=UPI0038219690